MARRSKKGEESGHADSIVNGSYELVAVKDVAPHPRNPRRGNVSKIRSLIKENGFHGALLVQKSTKYIIAGNHRYLAARDEGYSHLPVIWADVSDERALKILVADNRAADDAENDGTLLADILGEFDDLVGTGYSGDEFQAMVEKASPPTEFPEVSPDVETKYDCPKCGYQWS